MRSHLGWREERNILYKGVETSPEILVWKPLSSRVDVFNLEGKPERKNSKRTISTSVELGPLQ